jgi:hypothetical protein
MFRSNTPENLEAAGNRLGMVISDQFVSQRRYSEESFKLRYPDKPVLIHVGGAYISANAYTSQQMMEDRGLWQTPLTAEFIQEHGGYKAILSPDFVPMPDFPGYWVYEPGVTVNGPVPAQQFVELAVNDPERFEPVIPAPPSASAALKTTLGTTRTSRVVLLCPRTAEGKLDWLHGELGEAVATSKAAKTVTVRRFKTSRGWPGLPSGAYLAANAARYDRVDLWGMSHTEKGHPYHTPLWPWMMANLTPLCPVDPRTGLNAAEWFARHFIERLKKYYPHSDGFALDVTTGTFLPGTGFLVNADCDNDGAADMGQVGGVNYWALGMHDFVYYMRYGSAGKFQGLGKKLMLTWDSDSIDEQRLFHLLNGAEYEFGMIRDTGLFSSNLDRLLLWFERAQRPNLTFVSNKLPNPVFHRGRLEDIPDEPGYRVSDARLNMASAAMGTGYIHSDASRGDPKVIGYPKLAEERKRYGGSPLPLDYDEYHQGKDGIYGWLGVPVAPPQRFHGQFGGTLYRVETTTPPPRVVCTDERWQGTAERISPAAVRFHVKAIGPFYAPAQRFTLIGELPVTGVTFQEAAEYSLHFRGRGSSPYGKIAERYRAIPRGIAVRLRVNGAISGPKSTRAQRTAGHVQAVLLFEEERQIDVTPVAPASGTGVLEICLSESPGTIDIRDLELRRGSDDVLYRKFEHGLVVLNGSLNLPVTLPLSTLFPGEKYRRLNGSQDAQHNNGQPAGAALEIPAHDAYFLTKIER